MNPKMQAKKKDRFLVALAETGAVAQVCRDIAVSRTTAYQWRKDDHDFAERWDDALDCACALLEDEARRRAVDGVQKPVFQGGELVGHVTEYSDQLLIMLLRAANPAKYRTNARIESEGNTHITVSTGVPVDATEAARRLVGIVALAQARADAAEGLPPGLLERTLPNES